MVVKKASWYYKNFIILLFLKLEKKESPRVHKTYKYILNYYEKSTGKSQSLIKDCKVRKSRWNSWINLNDKKGCWSK